MQQILEDPIVVKVNHFHGSLSGWECKEKVKTLNSPGCGPGDRVSRSRATIRHLARFLRTLQHLVFDTRVQSVYAA
jgi:hypothetical protein